MIRRFGGASGLAVQPQGLDLGLGGSNIKSVQSGEVTISNGTDTQNVTIAPIDVTKSIVLVCTSPGTSSTPGALLIKAKMATATNLELKRYSTANAVVVSWQVVEFNNVKSKQSGYLVIDNAHLTSTVAISAVDTNKYMLLISFGCDRIENYNQFMVVEYRLTNSTTIDFRHFHGNLANHYIEWQVIEFN